MATINGTNSQIPIPIPSLAPLTGAATLRRLLSDRTTTVLAPGIYDGLTARIALSTGHHALYMTGAGTSLSRLGLADLGLTTQTIMLSTLASITALSPATPVIADADTGYGGNVQVSRTVAMYARAGCAALHIEDQVEQKRCGHLLGKELVEREVWWGKLRAAVRARDAVTPGGEGAGRREGMMIFARTDARQVSFVVAFFSLPFWSFLCCYVCREDGLC
jgi:2-methylisocitrate lyase-like PEP mutase family enzyme